jgi:hypothetical protein
MRTRICSHVCGIVVVAAMSAACPRADVSPGRESPPPAQVQPGAPQGALAPDFTASDEAGNTVTLAQHRGQKAVLLAFYPQDFTAG